MPDVMSDGTEAWVQLTAMELYADLCNRTQSGPDVLARALRLGYLRAQREQQPLPAVLAAVAQDDDGLPILEPANRLMQRNAED